MYAIQTVAQSSLPLSCTTKRGALRTGRALCATLGRGAEVRVDDAHGELVARYYRSPASGKVLKLFH